MGSGEVETLKARKKAMMNFDRILISKYSRTDYEMKKASVYRENFMEELEKLPDEFNKIKAHLKRYSNPLRFFDETQKSQSLQDFFVWYDNPSSYGGFSSIEELVEAIENDFGIYKPNKKE